MYVYVNMIIDVCFVFAIFWWLCNSYVCMVMLCTKYVYMMHIRFLHPRWVSLVIMFRYVMSMCIVMYSILTVYSWVMMILQGWCIREAWWAQAWWESQQWMKTLFSFSFVIYCMLLFMGEMKCKTFCLYFCIFHVNE